jgi:hypothetical protein
MSAASWLSLRRADAGVCNLLAVGASSRKLKLITWDFINDQIHWDFINDQIQEIGDSQEPAKEA